MLIDMGTWVGNISLSMRQALTKVYRVNGYTYQ